MPVGGKNLDKIPIFFYLLNTNGSKGTLQNGQTVKKCLIM